MISNLLMAQKEYDIWYFGENAGVNFNNTSPQILTDGQINTIEGTSVICDTAGNLLFYTDGEKVWNRNHQLMPNGWGLNGSYTSAQSALIVRKPGSYRYYYIFTADAQLGMLGGCGCLSYSVADLSLNAGLGDIIIKNQLIEANMEEKIAGIMHANNTDIWIVGHKAYSDKFLCYKLTATGLDTIAVVNNVGVVHGNFDEIGQLKFSPNGKKIAMTMLINKTEVFDFNRSNAIISNPIFIQSPFYQNPYGIEFSPNSRFLYSSAWNDFLIQYDLSSNNSQQINSTYYLIDSNLINTYGSLKLAKDGKIYMAKANDSSRYLSVINNPDLLGSNCNFVYDGLFLNNKISTLGLPNSIVYPKTLNVKNTCYKDTTYFYPDDTNMINNIIWDFNDSNGETLFSGLTAKHIFSDTSTYVVKAVVHYQNAVVDTLFVNVKINPLPNKALTDTLVCGNVNLLLNAGNPNSTYLWSNNQTSQSVTVSSSGVYKVKITNTFGCIITDSCNVKIANLPLIPLRDTSFCYGKSVNLQLPAYFPNVYWSTGDTSHSVVINQNKTITVTVTDSNSCVASKTIHIKQINSDFARIFANPHTASVYNPEIYFNVLSDTILQQILWNFGDGQTSAVLNPIHVYSDSGWYQVSMLATNLIGCVDSNALKIYIYPDYPIFIPNAFTPDDDGLNDVFMAKSVCVRDFAMYIYNRWGQLIFESENINIGWDGKYLGNYAPSGVYVYKIIFKDCINRSKILSGNCTLIR